MMSLSILTTIHGQRLSVSSYSYFGLGEQKFDGDVATHVMGGIATAYEDPFGANLNFSNPAANSKVRTTLFSTNITIDQMSFSGNKISKYQSTFYFSNIFLGFPLSKNFTLGLGYQPYTGYFNRMYANESFNQAYSQQNTIKGSGGLNSLHTFLSYKIDESWSVGLRGNFLFGHLRNQYQSFPWPDTSQISYQEDRIKGIHLTAGVLYTLSSEGDKRWSIGATYGIGNKVNVRRTQRGGGTSTLRVEIGKDTWITKTTADTTENIPLRLPMSAGLGVSYGEDYKWMLSAQYNWQKSSELNTIQRKSVKSFNETYRNSKRFALGGYWIPQYNSYKNYFAKAIYRAGLYHENTALYINNQGISDYGLTFGLGLPIRFKRELRESHSYLNIGLALGQRGTTQSNLTKENYLNLKIGFTFGAEWFQKRIYN
ncbi:MAG: hypothetical protein ABI045_06605 [Flavobacteriales bacterium]